MGVYTVTVHHTTFPIYWQSIFGQTFHRSFSFFSNTHKAKAGQTEQATFRESKSFIFSFELIELMDAVMVEVVGGIFAASKREPPH